MTDQPKSPSSSEAPFSVAPSPSTVSFSDVPVPVPSAGAGVGSAPVHWGEDGIPRSELFGDVYFSADGGWAESRHAFFDGCQVARRWAGKQRFTLGETGFGTGRNFLLTWQAWRADPQRPQTLDYLSVEGFPLTTGDLARALQGIARDPEVAALAEELTQVWPVAQPGFHLRLFDQGRVRLLLLFGDVMTCLPQISSPVDAWYLDGFAPSKNPQMWSAPLFQQVAALSRRGTRFGTYAAAGHVRRGLADAGFVIERRPGFGPKRECLAGEWVPQDIAAAPTDAPATGGRSARRRVLSSAGPHPWYAAPPALREGCTVAVIGGGVAGTAITAALARLGLRPELFERHQALAQEGSGNPCGLLKPRLTADGGIHGRFYTQAALYAATSLPDDIWVRRGILQIARDDDEAALQHRLETTLPAGHAEAVNAARVFDLAGISAPFGALWFPHAGAIRPQRVCQALMASCPAGADVPVHLGRTVRPLPDPAGGWQVDGRPFDAVVLAAASFVSDLWPAADLPIQPNRGQISVVSEAGARAAGPSLPGPALSYGGYLSPSFDDPAFGDGPLRVLGATYQRWNDLGDEGWQEQTRADHQAVADSLMETLPDVARALDPMSHRVGGRVALRASIHDHMPLAGPLFEASSFRQDFADLHHGRRAQTYPQARWRSGLFILGGLGSRGFQTAPLLAEHLAALMTGGVSPLPEDLAEAVHPARFLVRQLRKGPRRVLRPKGYWSTHAAPPAQGQP